MWELVPITRQASFRYPANTPVTLILSQNPNPVQARFLCLAMQNPEKMMIIWFSYTLPFSFPYFGNNITDIQVSTNGVLWMCASVEILLVILLHL